MRRLRAVGRWSAVALAIAALAAAGCGLWLRGRLAASLPLLDGRVVLSGLASPVTVETDAIGVPVVTASDRGDLARATGFLHAQNRFFQMDLLRRQAAGELAELLGPALVPSDRAIRTHRFRDVSRRAMVGIPEDQRRLLEHYAEGVNAGLAALEDVPFEYLPLRLDPKPWQAEDSMLVILAMFLTLNDSDGSGDSAVGLMRDLLPGPLFDFLVPRGTEWDAPITGGAIPSPPVPGPEVFDLRAMSAPATPPAAPAAGGDDPGRPAAAMGSNSWAVAGARTADGGALLSNDMHLMLSVPNIWYRASFVFPGGPDAAAGGTGTIRVTGVTLPGVPAMVVGSNGHVAWGFTNSYGDWVDLVIVEPDPNDADRYLTPEGPRAFDRHREVIKVKGGADETLEVVSTIWGPLIDEDHRGRPRALRWTAHDPRAVTPGLVRVERAITLEEALLAGSTSGIPPQNLVVVDASGRIGWTIAGKIPRRTGFADPRDARAPASWADGARGWDGWLSPAEYPRVVDPPLGLIWTANARVVEGEMLAAIGDGGYPPGARAGQIRDDLLGIDAPTARDMLAIQLDDRALFLERWRDLLLGALTGKATAADPRRAELRAVVEGWNGRASVDSASYRMVRAFRYFLARQVLEPLTARCRQADDRFDYFSAAQEEGPLWRLVTERPPHLIDPGLDGWDAQILAAVDATLDAMLADGRALSTRTWGERNTARIRHPLSLGLPWLSRWLDMPAEPLPGDSDMPRFQAPSAGASQRMVVSPGREEDGIFHMPCGQSGHPLSPHYRDGHASWARGDATPFLPGPPAHTLVLTPAP